MKHENEPVCTHCQEAEARSSGASRRELLGGSALAAAAMIAAPAILSRRARALPTGTPDVLVHVYLRGGMDGMTLVAPYGDAEYYNRRPILGIRPPGQLNGAVDLD